ncbi:C45 family autoproteolytic acyltransferase/hydrolase [Planctomicrobium sp.]|jgi:hypothetical protein|nr:C45 family peptidase [Planctomicrobium sp.]MDB4743055.1 C45 family autoproteolytic acyltransferase/hydrolase [Planctomicrobium sp.]
MYSLKYFSLILACFILTPTLLQAEVSTSQKMGNELAPLVSILSGQEDDFELTIQIQAPIDGKSQSIDLKILRLQNGDYELAATQADYSFVLQRTEAQTIFALPHHKVSFVGEGAMGTDADLNADGILSRLVSKDSTLFAKTKLLSISDPQAFAVLLTTFLEIELNSANNEWMIDNKVAVHFSEDGHRCVLKSDTIVKDQTVQVEYAIKAVDPSIKIDSKQTQGFKKVAIPRTELERQLVRSVSRATEILSPAPRLTNPEHVRKIVEHGELTWIDGQRVCILSGTPEEIGTAHGQLLKEEALKTIDSVLYTFGTVNTIRTGRWFRHDLNAAYERLSQHIPDDHKLETKSLAAALEIDEELAQTINVFPELFHCSGFAVFGSATLDGKLYHGRVLDYMTTIGLQDAATNFVVSVHGKIPFANVGYAGFIGSVTGMNDQAISLGEMGGHGEGKWDGVPMATLMRRALEECSTLDEVKTLWESSPRTCEYYYVFADGKTNEAVGVAATPDSIEFINPGQGHERLGEGIPDCVVLSAGSRLEKLRERVLEKHGEIDLKTAIWLMSRPVAMKSNLHNALFVPVDGVLYVANADHDHPAAERPYVKIDLKALLRSSTEKRSVSMDD